MTQHFTIEFPIEVRPPSITFPGDSVNPYVVSGKPGKSLTIVASPVELDVGYGFDGDTAIIRSTGAEWTKSGDTWYATGEYFWNVAWTPITQLQLDQMAAGGLLPPIHLYNVEEGGYLAVPYSPSHYRRYYAIEVSDTPPADQQVIWLDTSQI